MLPCSHGQEDVVLKADISELFSDPQRVGDWEGFKDVGFALATDDLRNTIHVVYGEKGVLYYSKSIDGGAIWSGAIRLTEGHAQQIAVDRAGDVHLF
jgi:hypothetical protein